MDSARESKDIFDDASRPPAARDLFAGSDELYKLLEDHVQSKAAAEELQTSEPSFAATMPIKNKFHSQYDALPPKRNVSIIKMTIRICIGLIALMLLIPISLYCISAILLPSHQHSESITHTNTSPEQAFAQPAAVTASDEPVSWKLAQSYYQKKDYQRALTVYNKLSQNLSVSEPAQAIWDGYLNLKAGLCSYKLKKTSVAETYFAKALQSNSPAIAALTNYHLSFIKNEQKNYSEARIKAYKAISLLETIDHKYSDTLIADSYFLIAAALTAEALSGSNQLLESPQAWPHLCINEPLEQSDEAELQSILQSGIASLNSAAMSPQIQKAEVRGMIPRWSAKCLGASSEELFAKFVSVGGQDARWACSREKLSVEPVTLYLTSTSTQKFFEIAAGSVGLLSCLENNQTVIYDPRTVASVAEHRSMLTTEAISSWQRFILSYHNDARIADAHFALGLLQRADNHLPTSTGEFEQIANRFMRSPLAPYALLNAAQIKIEMHDNNAARNYLKELCAQYPDSPMADRANILLAQTSMATGDYEYAQRVFRKIYNLNVSAECRLAAAFGAAKSYFALKDFTSAAEWFANYAALCKQSSNNTDDLRTVYVMLAQADIELGKFDDACRSYQSALAITPAADDYFDIAMKLVEVHLRQENFVDALDTLEKIDIGQLADRQVYGVWLTKAKILYAMNLADQAASLLSGKIAGVQDAGLRSQMAIQLAQCQIAVGNLEAARDTICKAMLHSQAGPTTAMLQCELADICVKLGDNAQAIKICSQILDSKVPADLRKRTQTILGTAYTKQKQYDKAAKIYSGTAKAIGANQL